MIKIVAASTILLAAIFISGEMLACIRAKIVLFNNMCESVMLLRSYVCNCNMNLLEASYELKEAGYGFYGKLNANLQQGKKLSESLELIVAEIVSEYGLSEEEKLAFHRLEQIMLSGDSEVFDSGIDSLANVFENYSKKYENELASKSGLYRKLSVYLALAIIIVIW